MSARTAVRRREKPIVMAKSGKKTPEPEPAQKTLFSIKGDPAWFEWLKRYADFLGVAATTTIDLAVREQAKRDGFKEPMPKRLVR